MRAGAEGGPTLLRHRHHRRSAVAGSRPRPIPPSTRSRQRTRHSRRTWLRQRTRSRAVPDGPCWQTVRVPVLLIRHAQAGNRKDWLGDDRFRPLSPKGAQQALGLVRCVKRWPPAQILSSPYTRCIQTVQPLADDLGLKVEETDELAEGSGAKAL